jgi:hypothetical protein
LIFWFSVITWSGSVLSSAGLKLVVRYTRKNNRFTMDKNRQKNQDKHIIVGAGEVGSALYHVLSPHYPVAIRDVGNDVSGKFQVLHIAYPPIKNFVGVTKNYMKQYEPKLVVVHSTVPVGTTSKIGSMAVHSPIRGMHSKQHNPGIIDGSKKAAKKKIDTSAGRYLGESLKHFVKYFGGPKAALAAKYFSAAGIPTHTFSKAETTEMLKVLDTTYYGWNIIFAKEAKSICDELGLDFNEVYTIPNRHYNEGYLKLGKHYVVRPVLAPMPGKIGGHCVIPNCHLHNSWLTKTVKDRNKKY